MQARMVISGGRLTGAPWERSWQGFADRSPSELQSMAENLAAIPPYDLDRDGMAGDTSWLTVLFDAGLLHLYFDGNGTARFEWYPDLREARVGIYGICPVDVGLEALKQIGDGSSPEEILRNGASEVELAGDE